MGKRLRPLGDISSLAESIREVGLINPISVTRDRRLVSGLHRLESYKALGRRTIPAVILAVTPEEAQLREIDENLARNDLSLLERAEHLQLRKELYEQMHPETRRGGNHGNQYVGGRKCQNGNLPFSQTAANLTGQSTTTVQRLVRIAKLLTPATKELVRGTKWENNQRALMKLCKLAPEMQERVARKAASGESRDNSAVAEPNINVVAAELVRDIESVSRKEKLEAVVQFRNRLNPTIWKNLILALKNAKRETANFEERLSKDFQEFPTNGKAHQRVIRERMAQQPEADIAEKRRLAADFKNAVVRQISFEEARNLILANEWRGNMGTTEFSYGLFVGAHLAGVVCFGSTAGTNVAASICGAEHSQKVVTLCRGACVHWAHPHSASYLVSAACREMTKKGYHIFVAYSDPEAGEIGSIYQSCNFLYGGMTSPTEQFRTPDGKIHDSRQVHGLTRDRTGGTLKYKRTRAEQKKLLIEQGCEFMDGTPKHRYVGIFGDRRQKRVLRSALLWQSLPYPKRQPPSVTIELPQAAASLNLVNHRVQ